MINKNVDVSPSSRNQMGLLCPVKRPDPALCDGTASSLLGLKVFIVVF